MENKKIIALETWRKEFTTRKDFSKKRNRLCGSWDLGLYSRVSGSWMRFVTNNVPIRFFNDDGAGTDANMTIEANGNVGIGTTSPQTKLDVVSSGSSVLTVRTESTQNNENAEIDLIGTKQDFATINFTQKKTGGNDFSNAFITAQNYGAEDVTRLDFGTSNGSNPTTKMTIFGNGQVCIGTNTQIWDNSKLVVNGKINAEEIEVIQDVLPDYVFERNYQLMSLDQLEKYIITNKHLPDIPTASFVKDNGMQLGKMNALLLKKVEELTLYIIDLQKQINQLKDFNK